MKKIPVNVTNLIIFFCFGSLAGLTIYVFLVANVEGTDTQIHVPKKFAYGTHLIPLMRIEDTHPASIFWTMSKKFRFGKGWTKIDYIKITKIGSTIYI